MRLLQKNHFVVLAIWVCLFMITGARAEVFLDINFSNQILGTEMLRTTAAFPGAVFTGLEPVGQLDETLNNDTGSQWWSGRLKIVNSTLLGNGQAMQLSRESSDPPRKTARIRFLPTRLIDSKIARIVTVTYRIANNEQQNSANLYSGHIVNSNGEKLFRIHLNHSNTNTRIYYGNAGGDDGTEYVNLPRLEANEVRDVTITLDLLKGTFSYHAIRSGSQTGELNASNLPFFADASVHDVASLDFGDGGDMNVYVLDIDNIKIQAQTYATLPTLNWQERSDWINVKTDITPAAVGDGVTDDTAAIQAALNNMTHGSVLYFPAGVYRISQTLNILNPGYRLEGLWLVGHGADTTLSWHGEMDGTMMSNPGVARSQFTGMVFDGRGVAAVGFDNNNAYFDTQTRWSNLAFYNFTASGYQSNPTASTSVAEVSVDQCIFNNCASGIKITKYNDYDFTIIGSDFINCGYGINCVKGNFYVRNSLFQGNRIADIYGSGTEHACSVRRCVSKDSAQFINYTSSVSVLTVQDCYVSNWTSTDGAISYSGSWRGTPLTLHNNSFLNPPDSNAPIRLLSDTSQKVIICNNNAPSSTSLMSPTPTTYTIPAGNENRNIADNGSEIRSFINSDASVPAVVYDVTTYGATPNDSSDNDATAIQNAINAAKNHGQGAIAYFPRGDYHVQSTLTIDGGDYVVGGAGLRTCIIWAGTQDGTIINVASPKNIMLENISVGTKASGPTNSAIDILHTSDGTASRMTYNGVWVHGTYVKQPETKGIVLSGLGSKDVVNIDQISGNIRINNSARATILGSVSYEGSIVIDDNISATRDGFTGFITRLTTKDAYPLIIRNNNNFVISDYYTEQGENGPMLSGVAGNPEGRVTICGAKTAYITEENQFFMDINNYQGDIFYGPNQFYITPNPFKINHTGTRPVNITVLGNSFYNSSLTLNTSGSATLYAMCNSSAGSGTPPADSYNAQTLQSVSAAFDDLQKLGDLDMAINYPNLNLGLHLKFDEAIGTQTFDATSNDNIGHLINGTSWTTGINQSALAFNGTTNYAYSPNVIGVPGGNDKQSVSWWQYKNDNSANRMTALNIAMTGAGICLGLNSGYIGAWNYSTKNWLFSTTQPSSMTWHHCAYTFDGNTHRLYVDGQQVTSSTTSPITYTPTIVRLGAYGGWTNADNFAGNIDNVQIFQRVLSDCEINLVYKLSGM